MLDRLPPEICTYIFDFACRDSGCTGRSLSLVSRYVYQTSELVRYTSIVLIGRSQILSFAEFVGNTSIPLKTRYLFINGQESEEELDSMLRNAHRGERNARIEYARLAGLLPRGDERLKDAKEAITREYVNVDILLGSDGAAAVETILRRLGPTLEILDIALNEYVAKMLLNPVSLPRLVDLTTRCGFPLRRDNIPALEPTPSLRHLHIVDTILQWHCVEHFLQNGISYFAPALTDLRLTQLQEDEVVITHLEYALGLVPPNQHSSKVTQLPHTLERVLLKPAVAPTSWTTCSCCDDTQEYRNLVGHARLLRDKDHRVLLLNADCIAPPDDLYFQEWREKADGAACEWDASDLDFNSADEPGT
ncbi:hypothetical protein MSAN_01021600 [Mycena sanguinolenta]|uniref:F-box domain-containing protein n=1 Tax=Mycena sanguinolenta TaxID=230812 RepID=A0A8H6YR50_9AGAR|nr:hypothetical protein MSAN_01021600 [Mycena sanguinolenta]